MNSEKIALAKVRFFEEYPNGFEDEKMLKIKKKHNIDKVHDFAVESFSKESFSFTNQVMENWVKIISKSSMVSLFEKPKFRDMVKALTSDEKEVLSKGLYEFLYGDRELGFSMMMEILEHYKMAKWTIVTTIPYFLNPTQEVFVKPTTVKKAIEFFEFDCVKYRPKPSLEFYDQYKREFLKLKKIVNVVEDNAAFGGFIMIGTGIY